ncbi:MAG: hypothetical protein WC376_03565 [Candidatus Nanoarchaeia archaeon]|jgi:hypothetical protein
MKNSNLFISFMIVLVAVSGCTININTGGNEPSNLQTQEQNSTNVTEPAGTQTNNNSITSLVTNNSSNNATVINNSTNLTEESEPEIINETITYEDIICSSLPVNELSLTTLEQDTEANAKQVSICSINNDVMNGLNYKYYTFTLAEPAKIYLMVDGAQTGAWQLGIIDESFEDQTNGEPVKYHADLEAGTYIVYVRVTNSLGSTCTQSADETDPCYFEFSNDETKWWIQGDEAGTAKLGFRLTISTSELEPSNTVEQGTATMTPATQSCLSLSAKTIDKTVLHDSAATAYQVSICDEISDTFTFAGTYQYYSITLAEETAVKLTLAKPEGAWQIGIDGYSWEDSTSLGQESVNYSATLPAGNYKAWVRAVITGGTSGADWSCQEVIADGTCYWKTGSPVDGTHYLNYEVIFDTE